MGIFDKIFGKKKNHSQEAQNPNQAVQATNNVGQHTIDTQGVQHGETDVVEITLDMAECVMDKLWQDTMTEEISITVHDEKPSLTDSKFGGIPYLPVDGNVPMDIEDNPNIKGRQLRLLAQINCSQLPANKLFPSKGILQFWVLDDDVSGADFDNYIENNNRRIVFYEDIDISVTEEMVKEKYAPFSENDYCFPIQSEFSLTFEKQNVGMGLSDYRFNDKFMDAWKLIYPNVEIKSFLDLPDEVGEALYEKYDSFGHKMGGYPAFTQEDPRSYKENLEDYNILLLQIDSIGTDENEIMWGDCGVANFFITLKDLGNKDFEKVAYNWDCC